VSHTINGKKSKDAVERRSKLHLEPAFRGRTLASITTADVRAFAAKRLEAGASPAEVDFVHFIYRLPEIPTHKLLFCKTFALTNFPDHKVGVVFRAGNLRQVE
jgi:hypothetical protein